MFDFPRALGFVVVIVSSLIGWFCLIGSVDLSLVSFNWFLTIFVDSFPVQVCSVSGSGVLSKVC